MATSKVSGFEDLYAGSLFDLPPLTNDTPSADLTQPQGGSVDKSVFDDGTSDVQQSSLRVDAGEYIPNARKERYARVHGALLDTSSTQELFSLIFPMQAGSSSIEVPNISGDPTQIRALLYSSLKDVISPLGITGLVPALPERLTPALENNDLPTMVFWDMFYDLLPSSLTASSYSGLATSSRLGSYANAVGSYLLLETVFSAIYGAEKLQEGLSDTVANHSVLAEILSTESESYRGYSAFFDISLHHHSSHIYYEARLDPWLNLSVLDVPSLETLIGDLRQDVQHAISRADSGTVARALLSPHKTVRLQKQLRRGSAGWYRSCLATPYGHYVEHPTPAFTNYLKDRDQQLDTKALASIVSVFRSLNRNSASSLSSIETLLFALSSDAGVFLKPLGASPDVFVPVSDLPSSELSMPTSTEPLPDATDTPSVVPPRLSELVSWPIMPHPSTNVFASTRVAVDNSPVPHSRGDRDITEQDLLDRFHLRGIQYGNWTNQKERQAFLNHIYDAFDDIAYALGVPTTAIGLAYNGTSLGIAVGARGRGGTARAHYEPSLHVINLTKTSGVGCIAHEFHHALDSWSVKGVGYGSQTRDHPFAKYLKTFSSSPGEFPVLSSRADSVEAYYYYFGTHIFLDNKVLDKLDANLDTLGVERETVVQIIDRLPSTLRQMIHDALLSDKTLCNFSLSSYTANGLFKEKCGEWYYRGYSDEKHPAYYVTRGSIATALGAALERMDLAPSDSLEKLTKMWSNFAVSQQKVVLSQATTLYNPKSTFRQSDITTFDRNATVLDRGRVSYWSTPVEKFARLGDAVTWDVLVDAGVENNFLAEGAKDTVYGSERFIANPNPVGNERICSRLFYDVFVGPAVRHQVVTSEMANVPAYSQCFPHGVIIPETHEKWWIKYDHHSLPSDLTNMLDAHHKYSTMEKHVASHCDQLSALLSSGGQEILARLMDIGTQLAQCAGPKPTGSIDDYYCALSDLRSLLVVEVDTSYTAEFSSPVMG